MIDIENIQVAVHAKLVERLNDIQRGRVYFERGAKARFLLQEEIQDVALAAVNDVYRFEYQDLLEYAKSRPDIMSVKIEGGELGTQIEQTLRIHLARRAVDEALNTLPLMPVSPFDILADVEQTISDYMEPIRHAHTGTLKSNIAACWDERTVESFSRVWLHTKNQATEMRALMHKLDIADPPTACQAAQAWRRLTEAADQLGYVLRSDLDLSAPTPGMAG